MPKLKALLAAFLLTLALPFGFTDTQEESAKLFLPFVSRLKATAVDNQIKVTWKDPLDVRGENLVYRSTEEITQKNVASAQLLARVPMGVGYFVDTPPEGRQYFYAVLVEDEAKKGHTLFIPFRNRTETPVAVATTATEEQLASIITGIKAEVTAGGVAIRLSYLSSNLSRDLLAFWGTSPLFTAEDLLRGALKKSIDPGMTEYRIAAVPGVDYFFAVLDAGLFKVGKTPLERGENTTLRPVRIPLTPGTAEGSAVMGKRASPLPVLKLTKTIENGRDLPSEEPFLLPRKRTLQTATSDAVGRILSGIRLPPGPEMLPEILESDSTPAVGGESASLQYIVRGQFSEKNYPEAERLVKDFLSLRRRAEVAAKARFYLGEIYYFQNKPREAALEFLLAEDEFYHETRPWLDACFRKLQTQQ